jgi:uncharacterized repeat protein (TIGR03803 family)
LFRSVSTAQRLDLGFAYLQKVSAVNILKKSFGGFPEMPHRKRASLAGKFLLILPIVLVLTASAIASNETVLYSFPGSGSGANPYSGLIADSSGNLYGTTGEGGNSTKCSLGSGCGTVFMLVPSTGISTVLYSFQGTASGDGSSPHKPTWS